VVRARFQGRQEGFWSEDLNNLLPFYRDLLGFKVGVQIEGFVVLGDQGAPTLALGTHSEAWPEPGSRAAHGGAEH
jgi:catechol-2,3-dioxygenase